MLTCVVARAAPDGGHGTTKRGSRGGGAFLSGTTAAELKRLARREVDEKSSRNYLAAMRRKAGKPNYEIAECIGENYKAVRVWLADIYNGHLCRPSAEEPGPARKNAAQDAPEDHGGGAQWAAGGRLQGRPLDVQVAVSARQEAGSRPHVRGSRKDPRRMGLRNKIPRSETTCGEPRGAHRLPEEDEEGAGGERQGRAQDRARGRGPHAGAQERACGDAVQGRAADLQAGRGARPPGPGRSRGRGLSVIKRATPATRRTTSRPARYVRAVRQCPHDRRRAGCHEPTCPRRTQAKTPAA